MSTIAVILIVGLILVLVVGGIIAVIVVSMKASNKMHSTFMRTSGLGNKLNERTDEINAKALKKLEEKLQNGEITQEQFEKRKKNLMRDYDFNQ